MNGIIVTGIGRGGSSPRAFGRSAAQPIPRFFGPPEQGEYKFLTSRTGGV